MKKTSSLRILRTSLIMFAAVTAFCFLSQSANAQSCGYGGIGSYGGVGYGGYSRTYASSYGSGISLNIGRGFGGYGGYNRGISIGYSSFRPSYGYVRRPVWHDTSHLDYHPGVTVRHGNHFDRIPGHYDIHRTGHWHR